MARRDITWTKKMQQNWISKNELKNLKLKQKTTIPDSRLQRRIMDETIEKEMPHVENNSD